VPQQRLSIKEAQTEALRLIELGRSVEEAMALVDRTMRTWERWCNNSIFATRADNAFSNRSERAGRSRRSSHRPNPLIDKASAKSALGRCPLCHQAGVKVNLRRKLECLLCGWTGVRIGG
jgi:hypothetical protein